MSTEGITHILTQTVDALSAPDALDIIFHPHSEGYPLPSGDALEEIISLSRSILFPGYYGTPSVQIDTMRYHIGVKLERVHQLLSEQIYAGMCFSQGDDPAVGDRDEARQMAAHIVSRYPQIRKTLATDVEAAYNGDPAAVSYSEVISCYPVIKALTNYRIAHELSEIGVPLIPRIMTEMAHSETGIDIHPTARIGSHFTIDHGTGVVIGATCIIGNHVKLYQGVTLGARSFPLDADGHPVKGIPRHPIIEDDVIIYSNATLLGRITVGKGSVIGANLWVTEDVPPYTRMIKR